MAATAQIRTPAVFAPRILLAVSGLSPQIVTETLYALAQQGQPAALPTEVHVVTTQEGAERARLMLLGQNPGWFHRLLRDCRLPPIQFNQARIHVVRDRQRRPLPDIRTPEENDCLADQITDLVRRFTATSYRTVGLAADYIDDDEKIG